jgi:hypothetical protein
MTTFRSAFIALAAFFFSALAAFFFSALASLFFVDYFTFALSPLNTSKIFSSSSFHPTKCARFSSSLRVLLTLGGRLIAGRG